MDRRSTLDFLFPGEPYFGGRTCGIQTPTKQMLALVAVVSVMARERRPVRVVEVGAWLGATALTWAHAIHRLAGGGDVLCIDLWEPYFTPADLEHATNYRDMDLALRSGLAYDLFQHNAGCAPAAVPIRHVRARSADALRDLPDGSADIVYIDGSHYYRAVRDDLVQARRVVREGGIIAGDDLELQLVEADEWFIRQHLDRDYITDPAGRGFHPGVTLAVGEVLGPVSKLDRLWCVRMTGSGTESVDLTREQVFIPPHLPPGLRQEARAILTPTPERQRRHRLTSSR